MNKKVIIGIVTIAVLTVGGFVGYTMWNNKQAEKQKQEQVEQQKSNTPVYQKNEDGEDKYGDNVTEEQKGVIEVRNFFYDCLNYSLNVPDTKNQEIMTDIKKFQEERFAPAYLQVMDKFYSSYDKLKLGYYGIKEIDRTTITTQDGEKLDGYYVKYTATFNDGNEDITLHEEGSQAKALISLEGGKLVLRQLTTSE